MGKWVCFIGFGYWVGDGRGNLAPTADVVVLVVGERVTGKWVCLLILLFVFISNPGSTGLPGYNTVYFIVKH